MRYQTGKQARGNKLEERNGKRRMNILPTPLVAFISDIFVAAGSRHWEKMIRCSLRWGRAMWIKAG